MLLCHEFDYCATYHDPKTGKAVTEIDDCRVEIQGEYTDGSWEIDILSVYVAGSEIKGPLRDFIEACLKADGDMETRLNEYAEWSSAA